jgi:hypothetical protein
VRIALIAVALLMLISAPRVGTMIGPTGADEGAEAILSKHRMSVVVTFALREGAAFLALVMGLLSGEMTLGIGIAALAVLTMAVGWPKQGDVADHLRRAGW